MERERGESFNKFEILKAIASPYYYVLPYQSQFIFGTMGEREHWNVSTFWFESRLNVGIKCIL